MTTCVVCRRYGASRCYPSMHTPGGTVKGTYPFRTGKTRRDHESGAWTRRYANRRNRSVKV